VKNLISLIVLSFIITLTSTAVAEPTYEKNAHVAKIVIKNAKTGYRYYLNEFAKPTTTLLKTCNGDKKYVCVYQLKQGKEVALYKFRDDGWTVAFYDFRYEIASR
jgi:predicted nucleic acid binding AN1-type Zn finger protein